jgi:hypothetical protein
MFTQTPILNSLNFMKKIFFTFCILLLLTSCKSYFANQYFKNVGVYDNKIKLEKISFQDKEIVFFGMHHIGKQEFYADVKVKVDSLLNEEYFFYTEGITSQFTGKEKLTSQDSIVLIDLAYRFRKISGKPLISKNIDSDYLTYFRENGIKIEEKIIMQPSYNELGLSNKNSINSDLKIEEILNLYEAKNGKIVLTDCDYSTPFFEKSICKENVDKKNYDIFIIDERNNSVISHILNDKRKKIAIIYGKNHFIGIKEELLKNGFVEIK